MDTSLRYIWFYPNLTRISPISCCRVHL